MFSKYFDNLEKDLLKKSAPSAKGKPAQGKATAPKKGKASVKTAAPDIDGLMHIIDKLIPSRLVLDKLRMIDVSGYSPEGADFIAFREMYRGIRDIMGGFIPPELVYGTFFVAPELTRENISEVLNRVVQVKKTNRFTDEQEDVPIIPSFIISYGMNMDFPQLKNTVMDYYVSRTVEHFLEFDILLILNRGLVVKNWREKRNFIALETGKDSLMWFFILMNEYLDVDQGKELDLRSYIKYTEKYREY